MGAINKITNNYEYPSIARKGSKYKCPSCEKDVMFRNGKIRLPHFAHCKSLNPCHYYEKPSETQIHKDAKLRMKTILENKREIIFNRICQNCILEEPTICEYKISKNDYTEIMEAKLEYKFTYEKSTRFADVALL
jgi:competence CoiA-like predicted nuclease